MDIDSNNIQGWIDAVQRHAVSGLDLLRIYGYLIRTERIAMCPFKMKQTAIVFVEHGLISPEGEVNIKAFRQLIVRPEF
ncbi:MAG: hypothetical protein ACTSQY_02740 [Candidatus Odinarchaeia archaeon]